MTSREHPTATITTPNSTPGQSGRFGSESVAAFVGMRNLRELADGFEARRVIGEWIDFYNTERPHSALGGKTPAEAYRGAPPVDMMDKPLRALPTSPQAQQQRQGDLFKGILAA